MPKTLRTVVICIIAEILNFIVTAIFYHGLKIPLFFDTIFTVAVVFYCGLLPALCVSIGYNLINSFLWICNKGIFDPFIFAYTVCGILIVFSTCSLPAERMTLRFLRRLLLVPGDFDHSVTGEKSQKVTRENDQKSHLTPLIIQFPEDCQKQFLPFL